MAWAISTINNLFKNSNYIIIMISSVFSGALFREVKELKAENELLLRQIKKLRKTIYVLKNSNPNASVDDNIKRMQSGKL